MVLKDRDDTADIGPALLAAIVAGSEDAIISKTLDSVVTSWNPAAQRLFGWNAEEMIGQSILRLIPLSRHHEEDQIVRQLRAGLRIERYETMRLRKDGTEVAVSLTISPIRDPAGNIIGASKIAHDISERVRATADLARMAGEVKDRETKLSSLLAEREGLLESERAARSEAERLGQLKDEFLATLSHELRTPLSAVQGWVQILQRGPQTPDQAKALAVIDRNVRAQSQIISELLDMSRIISGKIDLDVQPLQLQQVIQSAVDTVKQAADARGVRIAAVLDSTIGPIHGDANRLQQVFWNLLTNAVKFTPAGGSVQVILERVRSHLEISVEDSGIGIRADFLPYVFDRFRQGEAGRTRRYGGLGIGLSLVKTLVELHGGTVRVQSAGENRGSRFEIHLPISHVASRAQPGREEVSAQGLDALTQQRLEGARVLVVDDEADGRALLTRFLADSGAICEEAPSARAALQLLQTQHFDVLLSDVGMPEMDGYELIREVRALDRLRGETIPAIAITAYARPEDRHRSLLAGFQAHISKPIELRELVATIAGFLQLTR